MSDPINRTALADRLEYGDGDMHYGLSKDERQLIAKLLRTPLPPAGAGGLAVADVGQLEVRMRNKAADLYKRDGDAMKLWDQMRGILKPRYGGTFPREMFEQFIEEIADLLTEAGDALAPPHSVAVQGGIPTCLDQTGLEIVGELYKAINDLKGDPCLLGTIGSWGDGLPDADVLDNLKRYNEMGECFVPDVSAMSAAPQSVGEQTISRKRPDSIYGRFHLDNWTDEDFAKHSAATRKTLAWLLELEAALKK